MSQEEAAIQLAKVADELNRLSAMLGESGSWSVYVTQSTNKDDGYQIAFKDGQFELKYVERLIVHDVAQTVPKDEALYDAMLTLVQRLAGQERQKNPQPLEDYRRQTDPIELELLGKLNPAWVAKRAAQQVAERQCSPHRDPLTGQQQLDTAEFYYISSELQRVTGRPRR
jgi:hypothetical protein